MQLLLKDKCNKCRLVVCCLPAFRKFFWENKIHSNNIQSVEGSGILISAFGILLSEPLANV